jgi:hypothetical protein
MGHAPGWTAKFPPHCPVRLATVVTAPCSGPRCGSIRGQRLARRYFTFDRGSKTSQTRRAPPPPRKILPGCYQLRHALSSAIFSAPPTAPSRWVAVAASSPLHHLLRSPSTEIFKPLFGISWSAASPLKRAAHWGCRPGGSPAPAVRRGEGWRAFVGSPPATGGLAADDADAALSYETGAAFSPPCCSPCCYRCFPHRCRDRCRDRCCRRYPVGPST